MSNSSDKRPPVIVRTYKANENPNTPKTDDGEPYRLVNVFPISTYINKHEEYVDRVQFVFEKPRFN